MFTTGVILAKKWCWQCPHCVIYNVADYEDDESVTCQECLRTYKVEGREVE